MCLVLGCFERRLQIKCIIIIIMFITSVQTEILQEGLEFGLFRGAFLIVQLKI